MIATKFVKNLDQFEFVEITKNPLQVSIRSNITQLHFMVVQRLYIS